MKVFVIEDNPVYNDYVCNLLKKDMCEFSDGSASSNKVVLKSVIMNPRLTL